MTDTLIASGGWNKRISIFTFRPRTREWRKRWIDRKKERVRGERFKGWSLTQTAKVFGQCWCLKWTYYLKCKRYFVRNMLAKKQIPHWIDSAAKVWYSFFSTVLLELRCCPKTIYFQYIQITAQIKAFWRWWGLMYDGKAIYTLHSLCNFIGGKLLVRNPVPKGLLKKVHDQKVASIN